MMIKKIPLRKKYIMFVLFCIIWSLLSGCSHKTQYKLPLAQCGRIIAHEMGATDKGVFDGKAFNFRAFEVCKPTNSAFNTCPGQVTAISKYNTIVKSDKEKTIRFLKMSVRTLSDHTWVVAHNDSQRSNGTFFLLSKINSDKLNEYRKKDPTLGVYRIDDYVAMDKNKEFCFMFNTKTTPNEKLIDNINKLDLAQRTLIESGSQNDANWLNDHQKSVYFTTRVNSQSSLDNALKDIKSKGYKKLYSIEVDPNPKNIDETKLLVQRIQKQGFTAEVDSMPYDPLREFIITACRIPLERIGADVTMTSRPVECIEKFPNN
ncbi:TPA: hypothetical protein ACJG4C_001863 [Salmonella enterica subsp. diarizonae serovar 61:r:z53]